MPTIASNKLECRYHLDSDTIEYLNTHCSERGKGAFVSMAIRHYGVPGAMGAKFTVSSKGLLINWLS